jgi:hypothetical protein
LQLHYLQLDIASTRSKRQKERNIFCAGKSCLAKGFITGTADRAGGSTGARHGSSSGHWISEAVDISTELLARLTGSMDPSKACAGRERGFGDA